MKAKTLLRDITGAERVTEARRRLIARASTENHFRDHIREMARELHPDATYLQVVNVEEVSPTAKRLTFVPIDGCVLPPFQAGQYLSLDLKVGRTLTTRPYSICSAPFEARRNDNPIVQICVRNGVPGKSFAANWLYGLVKVGDQFTAHLPFGTFFHEPLRDASQVVALAGGSGITPFVSMAREINHGTLDIDLTILYGSVSADDIILRDELDALAADCGSVHLVHVLSGETDEVPEGFERGLLSAECIARHSPEEPLSGKVSFFVCGPQGLYGYALEQLRGLGVPERRIRNEVYGSMRDPRQDDDYHGPPGMEQHRLTVRRGLEEQVVPARSTEPIAVALERAAIRNHTRCRSGACGYCRCRLVTGDVFIPQLGDGRRWADRESGYIHACSTWPLSDCVIEVPIV